MEAVKTKIAKYKVVLDEDAYQYIQELIPKVAITGDFKNFQSVNEIKYYLMDINHMYDKTECPRFEIGDYHFEYGVIETENIDELPFEISFKFGDVSIDEKIEELSIYEIDKSTDTSWLIGKIVKI
ncbi:hypothetical protein ACFL1H_03125 [Nanoarchaeota archaeon]